MATMKNFIPRMTAAGMLAGFASIATAETPAFMGRWATAPSCQPHDVMTYGPRTIESDYQHCQYQSITQTSENRWTVQAGCLYEGQVSTGTLNLTVSGDRLHEEREGAPTMKFVRCAEEEANDAVQAQKQQGSAPPLARGVYVNDETTL